MTQDIQQRMSSSGRPVIRGNTRVKRVGQCGSCKGEFAIAKDGLLMAHGPKKFGCPGSWTKPTKVIEFGTTLEKT